MWVNVSSVSPIPQDIYFVVCYNPPTPSKFSLHKDSYEDPYQDLYANIIHYVVPREVILLRGFNAHTGTQKNSLHDGSKDALYLQEIDTTSIFTSYQMMLWDSSQCTIDITCIVVNPMTW